MANNHLTLKQYRTIDLVLIMVITLVFEAIIVKASTKWFSSQLYTVSVVSAMVCVALVRWGVYGIVVAVWGGFVTCVFNHADKSQYLIYMAGNCAGVLSLFLFLWVGKEKITGKSSRSVLYGLIVVLLMQVGRSLVSLALGYGFSQSLEFITTDALTLVFTAFLVFIARRQDGLFEDQIHYLKRVNNPEEEFNENNC